MGGGARWGLLALPLLAAGLLPGSEDDAPAAQPSGVRTFTFRQGPLTVGPYQVRYTSKATKNVQAPDVDGFIVGMHARVVDETGQPIPVKRLMLHHIVYKDLGRFDGERRDPVCGGRAESLYGNGEEDETLHFPPGYGYPIHRGDRWQTGWMFGQIVSQALEECGADCDADALNNVLQSGHELDLGDVAFAPVSFSEDEHDAVSAVQYYVWDATKGAVVEADDVIELQG